MSIIHSIISVLAQDGATHALETLNISKSVAFVTGGLHGVNEPLYMCFITNSEKLTHI